MNLFSSWWLDLKLAVRMLAKHPGISFAGAAGIAVAVALAAGASSVIYDNFLTTALPLHEGHRIVAIELWDSAAGKPEPRLTRDFQLWRHQLKSVLELGAFRISSPNLISPGAPPESVRVAAITASGFSVARVQPLLGRFLQEQDEHPASPPVVVIGESVWRHRFAADPAILGRSLRLGATSSTIVGVMPFGFAFPVNDQLWVPLRLGPAVPEPLSGPPLVVFGRLAPAASLHSAQAELTALGRRASLDFPTVYTTLRPQIMPYPRPFAGIHQGVDVSALFGMQGIFFALLVLVSLNVTVLVYTRTAMRQSEIGLRTALGASRGRIVCQLFIEAFVLSALASLAGLALASLALRWVAGATAHIASALPFWMTFQLSWQSGLYAAALTVVAAAIVGIVPALQATKSNLQSGLKIAETGGMALGRTWTILVVAQVGFAVAFLPPALAAAWNDARDGFAGLGFPAQEFLSANLDSDIPDNTSRFAASQAEFMRRLETHPQVATVSFSRFHPGNEGGASIAAEGQPSEVREARWNHVDINFFGAFNVPVLAGRVFQPADLAASPAASQAVVVNLPLAQQLFAGNALGRRIRYARPNATPGPWLEIVGIVADFPTGASPGMRDQLQLKVYHVIPPGAARPAALAIRLRHVAPAAFSPALRQLALSVNPDLHLTEIQGLDAVMRGEQWISRMTAAVFLAITLSVLLLSAAGIYALMSFTVSQRRKEIGIRLALGAGWRHIVAGIFSRALAQLGTGALLGAALGALLERASGGVLLRGNAAVVVPIVAAAIVAVGFLAALGPTRRGLRTEPTSALREQ